VLSLAAALRKVLGKNLDLRAWLDLVAIGTIADVAPLDGDNRTLVRAGLKAIIERPRPGLKALLDVAKISGPHPLTAADVAFRIAPRLNAPGRLGTPDLAVELLLSKSLAEAVPIAARIEQLTIERRALQDQMARQAVQEIERCAYQLRAAIVVGQEGWNHGIVGIVAGRLAEAYNRPVVAIGFQDGHGRGSLRGPAGSRLFDALERCKDLVVRYGGHQAAAGVELRRDRLEEFRACFESAVAEISREGAPKAQALPGALVQLAAGDDPWRVVADLDLLEPCGEQNPAPELMVQGRVVTCREVKGGHLKLELNLDQGTRLSAFGLGMGARAAEIKGRAVLSGTLRRDSYRGGEAVELRIGRIW
jgi:single-stranded-DNA-specific exonuclease